MLESLRERWTGWAVRLNFAALLLIFSELVVWQRPTAYTLIEWIALGVLYIAFAALALDLFVRMRVNETFSLFMIAGLYGIANGTLISHVTATDLPASLLARPMAALPLAFMGAFATFQILNSGRATGPLDFGVALIAGLAWGVWVRWFPVVADEVVPVVEIGTPIAALTITGVLVMLMRFAGPPADVYRGEDWQLTWIEWAFAAGALLIALIYGYLRDLITDPALLVITLLGGFMVSVIFVTARLRREGSFLKSITPPRRPNPVAWLILLPPFLLMGWVGYNLPGSGDSSIQSDILVGGLLGFAIVWPPAVSLLSGLRAYIAVYLRN